MDRETILLRLTEVFRDIFDDTKINITENTTSSDIVGWDSLMHIQLISATEAEFGVEFSVVEAYSLKNVGELVDLIVKVI